MCRCAGEVRELIARFLADANARLLAFGDETRKAFVVALGGDNDVIEAAPAGLESLGNRVHAVENFHVFSVDGALGRRASARDGQTALDGLRGAALAAIDGLRIENAEQVVPALGWG